MSVIGILSTFQTLVGALRRTPKAYHAANKSTWHEDSNDTVNDHGKNWRLPPDSLENIKLNRQKQSEKDNGHSEATHAP